MPPSTLDLAELRRRAQLLEEQRQNRKPRKVSSSALLERLPQREVMEFTSTTEELDAARERLRESNRLPRTTYGDPRGRRACQQRPQEDSSSDEGEPFQEALTNAPAPVVSYEEPKNFSRQPDWNYRPAARPPPRTTPPPEDDRSIASDDSFYSVESDIDDELRESPVQALMKYNPETAARPSVMQFSNDGYERFFETDAGEKISVKKARAILQIVSSDSIPMHQRMQAVRALTGLRLDPMLAEGLFLSTRTESLPSVAIALFKQLDARPEDEATRTCLSSVLNLLAGCLRACTPEPVRDRSARCVIQGCERVDYNLLHALLKLCDPACRGDLPEDIAKDLSRDAKKKSKAQKLCGVFVESSEDMVDCRRAFEKALGVKEELPDRGFMAKFFVREFCPVVHVVDFSDNVPTPIEDVWAEKYPDVIDKIPIEHDLPGDTRPVYVKRILPSCHALIYTDSEDQICSLLTAIESSLMQKEMNRGPLHPGCFVIVRRSGLVNPKQCTVRFERARGVLLEVPPHGPVARVYLMDMGDVVDVEVRDLTPMVFGNEGGDPLVKFMRIADLCVSATSGLYESASEVLFFLTCTSTLHGIVSASNRLPLTLKAMVKNGGNYPLRAALKILRLLQEQRHREGRTLTDPDEGYRMALILLGVLRLPEVNGDALSSLYHVLDLMPPAFIVTVYKHHDVAAQMDEVVERCTGDLKNLAWKIRALDQQNSVMLKETVNRLLPFKTGFTYRRMRPGQGGAAGGGSSGLRRAGALGMFQFGEGKPQRAAPAPGTLQKDYAPRRIQSDLPQTRPENGDDFARNTRRPENAEECSRSTRKPDNEDSRSNRAHEQKDSHKPNDRPQNTRVSSTHSKGVLKSIADLPDDLNETCDLQIPSEEKPQVKQTAVDMNVSYEAEENAKRPKLTRGNVLSRFIASPTCQALDASGLRDVDRDRLAMHICGFLNAGKESHLLIGMEKDTQAPVVRGIPMSRKDKDNFRIGFDRFLNGDLISPKLSYNALELDFYPVSCPGMSNKPDEYQDNREFQTIYIKIRAIRNSDTVFKITSGLNRGLAFFRDGNKTVEFTPQLMQKRGDGRRLDAGNNDMW